MGKPLDIEALKVEHIGKTYNWLTVLDAYRTGKKIVFKCVCKCSSVIEVPYNRVVSGHTKSCGCYIHSKEHRSNLSQLYTDHPERTENLSRKRKLWFKNNPDKAKEASLKRLQWRKEHPDKVEEQSRKYSEWCKSNPDKVKEKTEKYLAWFNSHPEDAKNITDKVSMWATLNPDKICDRSAKYSQWCKENREQMLELGRAHSEWMSSNIDSIIEKSSATKKLHRSESDLSALLGIVHPKYIQPLLEGGIKAKDTIETKCPVCGKYATHSFHNVFKFRDSKFKRNPPMCSDCLCKLASSSPEKEIANFISTFYNGALVRNSREIISPLELDLYYPEKKIAIEFNGDYFHNEDHKSNDYHYNKFITCKQKGINLVSIFEKEWVTRKELIKNYLFDLFNNVENDISFNNDKTMLNNNYPSPIMHKVNEHVEHYYIHRDRKVFTCGYEKLV